MVRTIVIDEEKCDGCGLCVTACHEGALELVDGKAHMTRGWLCDGIGDCLPACPQDAISFRESGMTIMADPFAQAAQWPIKLELVPARFPFFDGKDLIIAADCSAFKRDVMKGRDAGLLIGCPKLAKVDEEKLRQIITENDVRSVTVVRMQVPCCSPLASKTEYAVKNSGKDIPLKTVILDRNGVPQQTI